MPSVSARWHFHFRLFGHLSFGARHVFPGCFSRRKQGALSLQAQLQVPSTDNLSLDHISCRPWTVRLENSLSFFLPYLRDVVSLCLFVRSHGHQLLPPIIHSTVLSHLMTRHQCNFAFLNPSLLSHFQVAECCQINVPKNSTTGHQYFTKMIASAKEDTMICSSNDNEVTRKRANNWSVHLHLFVAFLFLVASAPSLLCSTEFTYQPCPLSNQLSTSLAKFKANESKF